MDSAAIVLCGGRSSRMGRAKAWLPWFGRPMVAHVVEVLREVVGEIVVVTSADLDLPPLPARIVCDREPERGPLAGIRDGLAEIDSSRAFVTSTDAPFLTRAYVRALLDRETACAPVAEGHVQVLSAVYPKSAALEAKRLLADGKARPLDLLEALDYHAFESVEFSVEGQSAPWRGFNTPEAYLAAVREVDFAASAQVELLGRAALHAEEALASLPVGTLGELLAHWPASLGLVAQGRVARDHLVSLGGRDLVRDLDVPVGPGERVSVIDALSGG